MTAQAGLCQTCSETTLLVSHEAAQIYLCYHVAYNVYVYMMSIRLHLSRDKNIEYIKLFSRAHSFDTFFFSIRMSGVLGPLFITALLCGSINSSMNPAFSSTGVVVLSIIEVLLYISHIQLHFTVKEKQSILLIY